MTDEKITQLLRSGAFNEAAKGLYSHFDGVYGYIKQHGGSVDDAKDLFQEAVLVFMKKVAEENETIHCKISTYLTTICKYQWNNKLRSAAHKNERPLEFIQLGALEDDLKDFESEEQQFGHLNKILQKLGERCKAILLSFYVQKQTMQAIAGQMGFSSVNSAKTQKYKCMEYARQLANDLTNAQKIPA